jgi:hypothetical protein
MRFDPVLYAMAKKGGSGGGGGGSADWNAKEGEAGYVKNRTHWEEEGIVALVDNQTYEFEDWGGVYGYQAEYSGQLFEFGKVYTVMWDGVSYENLVCFTENESFAIGESSDSLMGGSNECPFQIFQYVYAPEMQLGIVSLVGGVHTVSILTDTHVTHQIAPKYIKDMYSDSLTQAFSGSFSNLVWGDANFINNTIGQMDYSDGLFDKVNNIENMKLFNTADLTVNGVTARLYRSDGWELSIRRTGDGEGGTFPSVLVGPWSCSIQHDSLSCMQVDDDGLALFGLTDYSEVTDISFTLYDGELKKIDQKYLPSGSTVFYYGMYGSKLFTDADLNTKATASDVEVAITKGAIYICDTSTGHFYPPTSIQKGKAGGYSLWYVAEPYNGKSFSTGDYSNSGGNEE